MINLEPRRRRHRSAHVRRGRRRHLERGGGGRRRQRVAEQRRVPAVPVRPAAGQPDLRRLDRQQRPPLRLLQLRPDDRRRGRPEEASAAPREPTRPPTSSWTAPPWPRRMSPASPRLCGADPAAPDTEIVQAIKQSVLYFARPWWATPARAASSTPGRPSGGRALPIRPASAPPAPTPPPLLLGAPSDRSASRTGRSASAARGRRPQGQDHTEDGRRRVRPRSRGRRRIATFANKTFTVPGERQGHGPVQALPPQPPHLEALQAAADLGGGEAPQLGEPHSSTARMRITLRAPRPPRADPLGRPLRRVPSTRLPRRRSFLAQAAHCQLGSAGRPPPGRSSSGPPAAPSARTESGENTRKRVGAGRCASSSDRLRPAPPPCVRRRLSRCPTDTATSTATRRMRRCLHRARRTSLGTWTSSIPA